MGYQVTEFDKYTAANLRDVFEEKIKEIAEDYGITVEVGGVQRSALTMAMTMNVSIGDHVRLEDTPQGRMFQMIAPSQGLQADDLGRSFRDKGKIFTIKGWNRAAPKYPIVCEELATGATWRYYVSAVKDGIVR